MYADKIHQQPRPIRPTAGRSGLHADREKELRSASAKSRVSQVSSSSATPSLVSVKSRLGSQVQIASTPSTTPLAGRKRQRGDSPIPQVPSPKRLTGTLYSDRPETHLPQLLKAHRKAKGQNKLNIVKNQQTFDQMHDWLNSCTEITPETIEATELLYNNFRTLHYDETTLIDRINKLEALREKFHHIKARNPISPILEHGLNNCLESMIQTIYDNPNQHDCHHLISVLISTQSIWKKHPVRAIRFKALEVIFNKACTTKNYQPILKCLEIYQHNKNKARGDNRQQADRIYPLYVRLVNATGTEPPDEILKHLEHLKDQDPIDRSHSRYLCTTCAECSECILKLRKKNLNTLINQLITKCSGLSGIKEKFKNDQLIQLRCVQGRYCASLQQFEEAQQALERIKELQENCNTKTVVPLVVKAELAIGRAEAARIDLTDNEAQPLLKELEPHINTYEGARVAAARLFIATGNYRNAKQLLGQYQGSQTLPKRLLGMCMVQCEDFHSADTLFTQIQKETSSDIEFSLTLREHAICHREWAHHSKSRNYHLNIALDLITKSIRYERTRSSWDAMGHICENIREYSALNFHDYREQLRSIFNNQNIHNWKDATSQAFALAKSGQGDAATLEPSSVLLPMSSFSASQV